MLVQSVSALSGQRIQMSPGHCQFAVQPRLRFCEDLVTRVGGGQLLDQFLSGEAQVVVFLLQTLQFVALLDNHVLDDGGLDVVVGGIEGETLCSYYTLHLNAVGADLCDDVCSVNKTFVA